MLNGSERMEYFRDIGRRIEVAWREHHYDEEALPDLASDVLRRLPPVDHVAAQELVRWAFKDHYEALQLKQPRLFGEPPLVVFRGPRFYIEAIFWLSATTDIHEHAFSGAFSVLAGSSVHSHWRFEQRGVVNSRMLYGRLHRESTEILLPGGVRPIRSGDRLIHQLFHLEVPSVTIVVRTYHDRHHLPQYRYLLPGLAIDEEDPMSLQVRRLKLIDGMARGHLVGLEEAVDALIKQGDLEALYSAFSTMTRRKVSSRTLDSLYQRARERHGEIIALFREACEEERRTRIVISRRTKVSDPDARFLLALLMLMPDREAVFETARLRFPDRDPLDAIVEWTANMSGKKTIGFDFTLLNRSIFRGLVDGVSHEELIQRLEQELGAGTIAKNREKLDDHIRNVARSDLFRPLFTGSPIWKEVRAA